MRHGVFISYRRTDTAGYAGRLSDELERRFAYPVAFHDIDSIRAGEDFVVSLQKALDAARVCIVLIGDDWLWEKLPDGTRRLDDPADFVRREIEMALDNDHVTVLPVLVEGAQMPAEAQLPASLARLARLQALELSDSRWDYDLSRLVEVLARDNIIPAKSARQRLRLAGAIVAAIVVATIGFNLLPRGSDTRSAYTGIWYLPTGSYWSVSERGTDLWVEETHYESREIWKQGAGEVRADTFTVALELVFQQEGFQYLHTLQLSSDGNMLQGSMRRSDQQGEEIVTLTRQKP